LEYTSLKRREFVTERIVETRVDLVIRTAMEVDVPPYPSIVLARLVLGLPLAKMGECLPGGGMLFAAVSVMAKEGLPCFVVVRGEDACHRGWRVHFAGEEDLDRS